MWNPRNSMLIEEFSRSTHSHTWTMVYRPQCCKFWHYSAAFIFFIWTYTSYIWNILQRWNNPLLDSTGCTEEQYWQNQVQSSSAFLCHLNVVKIYTNFSVFYSMINNVRFLLEHGRSLQDMNFCCSVKPLSFWLNEIRRIEGFPRASSEVKISVASWSMTSFDSTSVPECNVHVMYKLDLLNLRIQFKDL